MYHKTSDTIISFNWTLDIPDQQIWSCRMENGDECSKHMVALPGNKSFDTINDLNEWISWQTKTISYMQIDDYCRTVRLFSARHMYVCTMFYVPLIQIRFSLCIRIETTVYSMYNVQCQLSSPRCTLYVYCATANVVVAFKLSNHTIWWW